MEGKIVYFEKTGAENTEAVLRIAKLRADELGIGTILVASTRGDTAVRATEVFQGKRVVVVSRTSGRIEPNIWEFTEENRLKLASNGTVVLNSIEAFSGVDRAMRKKFNMYLLADVIAYTLRIFGTGLTIACEISLMAADAGLVRTGEDVIAIAGSHRGADTAIVLKPVNSADFFDLRVKEILCKPLLTSVAQAPAAAGAAAAMTAPAHPHH